MIFTALQMQCSPASLEAMKSSNIPTLWVSPELCADASLLREGESLSRFAEDALGRQIEYRKMQHDFLERGLVSGAAAKSSVDYSSLDEVTDSLRAMLGRTKASR